MVGGTTPPQSDSGEISRVLVLNLLWQSKRCSRTAQDISVLTTPSLLSRGTLVEILPWTCPLTWAENFLETRAGIAPYQGGFLLHYLDALVYPNIPPGLHRLWDCRVCRQSRHLCSPFPAPRARRLVRIRWVETKAQQGK